MRGIVSSKTGLIGAIGQGHFSYSDDPAAAGLEMIVSDTRDTILVLLNHKYCGSILINSMTTVNRIQH